MSVRRRNDNIQYNEHFKRRMFNTMNDKPDSDDIWDETQSEAYMDAKLKRDEHIVRMPDDQYKKIIDAAYELETPAPTFFQQTPYIQGAELGAPTEDDGVDMFFSLFRTMIEQQYILGKMTKHELIESLRKLYADQGLDIAEAVEEIEITKERFIRRIIDQAKAEMRKELNG